MTDVFVRTVQSQQEASEKRRQKKSTLRVHAGPEQLEQLELRF